MTVAIQFAVLGLGGGAVYALLAEGLLVTYAGSGVLNFAQCAQAMLGAYLFWELRVQRGWSFGPAFVTTVLALVVLGGLIYRVVMRPLRHVSTLAQVVATLGVLVVIQSGAALIWGLYPKSITSSLPSDGFEVGGVFVPVDRLYLTGIAIGLSVVLALIYSGTPIGLALRASAQHPRTAASLGWSPDALATISWGVGSGLAAVGGILIAPLIGITNDQMPLLVIPVLAAALIGGFRSIWLTVLGAFGLSIAQSELGEYVSLFNASWGIPFIVIVLLLVIRGKGLPTRSYFVERSPLVGSGIVRWRMLAPATIALVALILWVFPIRLNDALTVSFAWAVLMLSVVVLLGFTGQLSFEQMAMAGLAAIVAARGATTLGLPFLVSLLLAVAAAVPIGALFAVPALRARGTTLAVVTLGLGMVVAQMVLGRRDVTGGDVGFPVPSQTIAGVSIDPVTHGERYTAVVLVFFVLCALVVANVRRGSSGSALLAVRSNERAAAALGISVLETKLFAFVLGSSLAAIGGVLLAFQYRTLDFTQFNPFQSVLVVAYAVIGGVGFLMGPILACTLVAGGFGGWVLQEIYPTTTATQWIALIGGINLLFVIVTHPNGIAGAQAKAVASLEGRFRLRTRRPERTRTEVLPTNLAREVVGPGVLTIEKMTIRFGGITALNDVSIEVRAGEVVGLIGPNGAGKTTLIDGASGFVRPQSGEVLLNGRPVTRWPAHRRSRAGLSRSFQALELFEDGTVRDNLRVASDNRTFRRYVADLLRPGHRPLSPTAVSAIREFGLEDELDRAVTELSYGHRRLAAIARAIATRPSVLLLDEPAAGLSGAEVDELARIVRSLAADWGMAVLLVEHDISFVLGVCNRVVVLDFGRRIAEGAPDEVRRNPAVITAYLGEEEDSPMNATAIRSVATT